MRTIHVHMCKNLKTQAFNSRVAIKSATDKTGLSITYWARMQQIGKMKVFCLIFFAVALSSIEVIELLSTFKAQNNSEFFFHNESVG